MMDLGAGGAKILASGQNPVWGPGSRHLIYSAGSSLILLDVPTGRTTTIVTGLGKVSEPTWSR
jgi:TolB protein